MISAAELRARVVVEGVPKGNKELGVFEGTLKRVSGLDATATLHADIDQSGFQTFEGELRDVSGRSATATLEADVRGRGFDEFAARVDAANLRTSRPITQTVKADVDERSFTATMARIGALKRQVDRDSGGGGLTHSAGGIIAPFGALPSVAALASPELLALAGAATAVAGSAGEAALGIGAMTVGGIGASGVGIAGIVGVAVPAIGSLKELTKAQTAYSIAVRTYGKESSQAETALKKLNAAEKMAGPEAVKLAGALGHVKHEWAALSAPGRNEFLGALADGIDHLEAKLPMLAKSANRSTASMRHDVDLFLNEATGKGSGFDHFIGSMTDLFVHEGPMISHTLADWAKILEHVAEAAGPSLERETKTFEHWSDSILHSTEDAPKLRKEIGGLVDQTETWIHFLGQGTDLIFTIFGAGAGQGQSLVEDATGKIENWRHAIEADPSGTESFFAQSGEDVKELSTILAGLAAQWYVEATAMEPVAHTLLSVVDTINSLKVGNVSALTLLVGGGFAIGSAAKLIKTIEILKGYAGIRTIITGEETEQAALIRTQEGLAASTDRLAAANEALAGSVQSVTAAQAEQAVAAQSGQLSMLEAGVVGEAEQAGQLSMFPMGGGVVPQAEVSNAAETAAEAGAGGGVLTAAKGALKKGLIVAGGLAGGYFAAEFGAHVLEGITGADLLENQSLLTSLTHGFNTEGVLETEVNAFQNHEHKNAKLAQAQLEHLKSQFHDTMLDLRVSAAGGMGVVNAVMAKGLMETNKEFHRYSPEWRDQTATAMRAAVNQIEIGMADGTVNAKRGQEQINKLLARIHLIKGSDPLGLAQATTAGFKNANQITGQGVNQWIRKLEVMPPSARRSTVKSTEEMLHAWAEGHPKLEHQLDALTAMEIHKFGATNRQLREGVEKGATGPVAEAFREAALGVGGALDNIGTNTNAMLKAVGAKDFVNFQAIVFGPSRRGSTTGASGVNNPHSHAHSGGGTFATGGIVPGVATGDVHHTSVPAGSFILNKKATAAYGFQEGGMVPVALEPTERYFHPDEVAQIGLGNLMAMNASVPRFAEGGHVDVAGPRSTGSAGHGALSMATHAVNAYIKAHSPKPKTGGAISLSGGLVASPLQFAEYMLQAGFPATVKVLSEGLGTIMSESGFRVNNAQGPGGHIGPWAESPAFGSVKVREDPLGSTIAAHREWARDGRSFWQAWGQWEAEQSGLSGGGAGSYASQFRSVAQQAVSGGRKAKREKHAAGGIVGLAAGGSVPPPGKHKDWSWAPHLLPGLRVALAGGGIADAAHVIEWAQAHLGQGARPGYTPGEWCGDFTGEDIQVHGMTPPAGYPVAVNWANWGKADSHPEYGDVVVIGGSGHVGFALGGNKMISGNFSDKVAESTIGEAAGGRPVLGYRTPPYTHASSKNPHETKAEETAHTYKETPKKIFHGCHTDALSLGSGAPKSIEVAIAELHRREGELARYEAAVNIAEREHKPATAQALQHNIAALNKRIRELGRALRDLRVKAAEKRTAARLSGQLGHLTGMEQGVEKAQHRYNKLSEVAEHIVDLEPTIGESEGGATNVDLPTYLRYVNQQEVPAYERVLAAEAEWRNKILAAERRAAGDWDQGKPHVGGMEGHWEDRIGNLVGNEKAIESFAAQVQAELDAFHRQHPKADLPDKLKARRTRRNELLAKLPLMQFTEKELRTKLGEGRALFYPGGATVTEPKPPLPGTGTFEGYLEEVQGIHFPDLHEYLAGLPHKRDPRSFGGAIWDTQGTIEELGLKLAGAIGGATAGIGTGPEGEGEGGGASQQQSELTALEKEGLLHYRQREAVGKALEPTLAQYEKSYPLPYMGAYAEGGVALVGDGGGPELAHFPSGTRVHSYQDTQQLLGGHETHVVVNGSIRQEPGDTRDPIEVWMRDPRNQTLVRQIIDTTPKGITTSGAGRAFR